ncbi:PREDICTED: uncharacterized protein LOC109242281 isoform X4 [Nicotiana attenuata]|uniref:uncharacterized protein LOC109242281 isoform X4 n=1 Tax=Nicotiana attenuata TaxID=49451 RepID=UPI0009056D0C|nr:PREDICTED: uncharacterized protein LOC109242281 isoform X4 [Nicotiana attenuata]
MAVPAKINPDHHHYLHASDLPGLALVSPPFDGSGYGVWRKYILIALSAKNKLCFIDGSLSRPKDDSPDSKYWIRCDYMAELEMERTQYASSRKLICEKQYALHVQCHARVPPDCNGRAWLCLPVMLHEP